MSIDIEKYIPRIKEYAKYKNGSCQIYSKNCRALLKALEQQQEEINRLNDIIVLREQQVMNEVLYNHEVKMKEK